VLVPDHHPAIFTLEEYERMKEMRDTNSRTFNAVGKVKTTNMVYVFGGICYCGKCLSRMSQTPGKLHADGYRSANYSCPKRRKTKDCDNATVSDLVIGEFVVNYILNMINAKKSFSGISSPEELQSRLLRGSTFAGISCIEGDGLNELFNLLSRYGSDGSYTFAVRKPKKKAAVNPEVEALRREKEKQERALRRLQELYLYSDSAITEKDFIIRKKEITARIDEVSHQLGLISRGENSTLSDEDFIRLASHLLIVNKLKDKEYVYYRGLASNTSPEVLKEFIHGIVDSIYLTDGHVSRLVFKNGLTHNFIWK